MDTLLETDQSSGYRWSPRKKHTAATHNAPIVYVYIYVHACGRKNYRNKTVYRYI